MALNGTLTKIETAIVGVGGAASITFAAIPQTYKDLYIVLSGRSTRAGNNEFAVLEFNGSRTNTSMISAYATTSNVTGFADNNAMYGYVNSAPFTTDAFGNALYYITDYTSSNNKVVSINSASENNSSTQDQFALTFAAGRWASSSAVTSLTLEPLSGSDSWVQYTTATLYGVGTTTSQIKATGGSIYEDTTYVYHLFGASGIFTPNQALTCDVLVVAGGGGAVTGPGGGAGAAQSLLYSAQNLTATNYAVTVGAGGSGGPASTTTVTSGSAGGSSQFASLTASTAGNGSTSDNGASSGNGNSGGNASIGAYYTTGGGGGMGAAGTNGNGTTGIVGVGGAGIDTYASWTNATNIGVSGFIGGGGGGGAAAWSNGTYLQSYAGIGGSGGGGGGGTTGSNDENNLPGENGTANTGSGGGGGGYWFQAGVANRRGKGGNGGSGVVIVRYTK
jgi:hypothetical protein